MKITIAICTFNRVAMLKDTLDGLLSMEFPVSHRVEIMVIDNNSKDGTRELVENYSARNRDLIRYEFEPNQGLSHARNKAIVASNADLLAYVDDDVFLDGQWLVNLMAVFENTPGMACLGGKTIPHFESGRPDWVSDSFIAVYGASNSGDVFKRMLYPEHPFGVNMVFRRSIFETIGMFDPRLGRINNALLSNEESDVFRRVAQAGLPVYYSPDVVLKHRIPATRASMTWVLDRYYWQGISDAVLQQVSPAQKDQRNKYHAVWRALTKNLLPAWWAMVLFSAKGKRWRKPARYFDLRLRFAYCKGELRQLFRSG